MCVEVLHTDDQERTDKGRVEKLGLTPAMVAGPDSFKSSAVWVTAGVGDFVTTQAGCCNSACRSFLVSVS